MAYPPPKFLPRSTDTADLWYLILERWSAQMLGKPLLLQKIDETELKSGWMVLVQWTMDASSIHKECDEMYRSEPLWALFLPGLPLHCAVPGSDSVRHYHVRVS